jgi:sterol desaturase/sphingolipid hydroxylase (fatty acid hydroxylase superfamily)
MAMLKSKVGMPPVRFSGQRIDLRAEAQKARRRLYPATILYSTYATSVLVLALATAKRPYVPVGFYAAGWMAWTLVEYLAHRYVLHYRFPDGPGIVQHWLHRTFDNLHTEHHARPWDGSHINGTIKDTLLYMTFFAAASFLAPLQTAPAFWAAVMQAYVVEEWVHQGTHYPSLYRLKGPYWNYITRHHSYHHSPRGAELAFGLTNGFWDVVFGTRVPERDRELLHGRRPGAWRRARAA